MSADAVSIPGETPRVDRSLYREDLPSVRMTHEGAIPPARLLPRGQPEGYHIKTAVSPLEKL